MSCRISVTFHLLHRLPASSHHVRPVASVPSLGAAAVAALRLDGGAGGQQHLDHVQVAFRSRNRQRPGASVRRVPLEMATGRAKSRVDHVPTKLISAISATSLKTKNQSQLVWEVTAAHLQQPAQPSSLYPFSGFRHVRRLAPGSGGPPAASVGQLQRCLLSQPAGCLRLKTAETLDGSPRAKTRDVWQSKVDFLIYYAGGSVIMS